MKTAPHQRPSRAVQPDRPLDKSEVPPPTQHLQSAKPIDKWFYARIAFAAPLVLHVVYLILQSNENARLSMKSLDSKLGVAIPEKNYALDCSIGELWDKIIDPFVIAHFVGWMVNAMISRTFLLTVIISGVDEFCELWWRSSYGNFRECWWDHLILDMLLANTLGALCGALIMKHQFGQKRDYFQLFAKDQRHRGWLYLINLLVVKAFNMFLLFGFKSVLWVPPAHWLNAYRMLVYCMFLEAVLSQTWDAVVHNKGGWRTNTWALAFWAIMAIDGVLMFKMGYHVPIWENMNTIGKVFFWIGTAVAGFSFSVFFK